MGGRTNVGWLVCTLLLITTVMAAWDSVVSDYNNFYSSAGVQCEEHNGQPVLCAHLCNVSLFPSINNRVNHDYGYWYGWKVCEHYLPVYSYTFYDEDGCAHHVVETFDHATYTVDLVCEHQFGSHTFHSQQHVLDLSSCTQDVPSFFNLTITLSAHATFHYHYLHEEHYSSWMCVSDGNGGKTCGCMGDYVDVYDKVYVVEDDNVSSYLVEGGTPAFFIASPFIHKRLGSSEVRVWVFSNRILSNVTLNGDERAILTHQVTSTYPPLITESGAVPLMPNYPYPLFQQPDHYLYTYTFSSYVAGTSVNMTVCDSFGFCFQYNASLPIVNYNTNVENVWPSPFTVLSELLQNLWQSLLQKI